MLTQIHVNGFRSLNNFSIEIRPGLNILIGPNGGGKSNIISFFQFLSRLMNTNLSDAVSLTGGAGAFFQKTGEKSFQKEVTATVRGISYVEDRESLQEKGWMQYEYMFVAQASERFDSIIFSQQSISVRGLAQSKDSPPLEIGFPSGGGWDLVLESCAESPSLTISTLKEMWLTQDKRRGKMKANEIIEYYKREFDQTIFRSTPLIRFPLRHFAALRYIIGDLIGGEALNINPTKVKEPEDIAREPGIRSDGSGLAATLWHLRNGSPTYGAFGLYTVRMIAPFYRQWPWPRDAYDQLQSLIRLVNSQIKNIDVINEPFDNQLKIKIRMTGPSGEVDLPLGAMSDGTIKWASLITAILTYPSIFAIEEPENFLHPLMLIEILKLMRSTTADKFSFVLMTTHSETLLNSARPDEIIVVFMENGVTCGRRPKDPRHLSNEIRETGFGLGHYYLAGDLTDA